MRYVPIRPRPQASDDWWDDPIPRSQTVICDDDEPVRTGLYDSNGVPLYRVLDRIKPGFCK